MHRVGVDQLVRRRSGATRLDTIAQDTRWWNPPRSRADGRLIGRRKPLGAFLAVDRALMTDIIPKAMSGRYVGISNVATASAGPVGLLFGGVVLDAVTRTDVPAGPRIAFLVTLGFYALGALCLVPVDARRRED